MKSLLFITTFSILAFVVPAISAQDVIYVRGYGYSSGFCQAGGAQFCIRELERRAQDDAFRDADWNCRLKDGNLQGSSFSCYANCNPSYIPPNQQAWVNCRSDCDLPCYIYQN